MQTPGVSRAARLTPLFGIAGLVGVLGLACASPEGFHKNRDGGLLASSGGATGAGGDIAGTGGGTPGSGGDDASTGGASASGGAPEGSGGSGLGGTSAGGAPGTGGTAGAAGGTVVATGGRTAGTGGGLASGGAAGGAGGGGRGTGGAGGYAGVTGMGGSAAGGAASMACPACTLTLTYLPIGTADGQSISAEVHVATTAPVAINQISIKYWYTNETGESDISTDIDYIGLSTGQALARPTASGTPTTVVTPARTFANTVTTITVPETTTLRPGTQLYVKFRIHATNYKGKFMMANDYSFGPAQTLAMEWPRITAYVGGVRAWGNEPTAP